MSLNNRMGNVETIKESIRRELESEYGQIYISVLKEKIKAPQVFLIEAVYTNFIEELTKLPAKPSDIAIFKGVNPVKVYMLTADIASNNDSWVLISEVNP